MRANNVHATAPCQNNCIESIDTPTFPKNINSVTNRRSGISNITPKHQSMVLFSSNREDDSLSICLNEDIDDSEQSSTNWPLMVDEIRQLVQSKGIFRLLPTRKSRIAASLCGVVGLGTGYISGYFTPRQFNTVGEHDAMMHHELLTQRALTDAHLIPFEMPPAEDDGRIITAHQPNTNALFEKLQMHIATASDAVDNNTMELFDSYRFLIEEWDLWAKNATILETRKRNIAVKILKECLLNQSDTLSLVGLTLTKLPNNLPANITELIISGNLLTQLPEKLPGELVLLNIGDNQLTHLPDTLPTKLKKLIIGNNQLTRWPEKFPSTLKSLHINQYKDSFKESNNLPGFQLPDNFPAELNELNISHNRLTHLPNTLPTKLKKLYIDNNQLTTLPDNFPDGVEKLYIGNNLLTYLPENLPSGLKKLHSSLNKLTRLPKNLPGGLEELFIQNSLLTYLPEILPAGLKKLSLGFNQLTQLPELPVGLKKLYITGNQLDRLPALPAGLELLQADYNQLTHLPELPTELKELHVASNRLTYIPEKLPIRLKRLYISSNKLTRLPALSAGLTELYAANNQLTELPRIFPSALQKLDVSHNKITCLPQNLPEELNIIGINTSC